MSSTELTLADPALRADLAELTARGPLTHCITNVVAAGFTANVLLAVGASPAMISAVEEAGSFARVADALLINVGTVTREQAEGMHAAAQAARDAGTPWVLDPVGVGGPLAYRTQLVGELLAYRPAVIRGNASEILTLAGAAGSTRGVESTASAADAAAGAQELAQRTGAIVAVSGEVDHLTDGSELVRVPGGHILLTKVTGTGCALGGVIAALLAVSASPLRAASTASALFAAAGREAAAGEGAGQATAPGTFAVAFLDALHRTARSVGQ